MEQIHFAVAVASHSVHTGYAVPVLFYVSLDHILRMGDGDLQGYPLIPVMEGGNGLGGDKQEQDGIPGIKPSEHIPENAQDNAVACKHILPNGFPGLVGHIKCNKVSAAGGGISAQCNGNGKPVQEAAEHHIQKHIVKQWFKVAYLQEKTGKEYLQHGIKGETHTDAFAAQKSHRYVEDQHSKGCGDIMPI